MERKLTVEDARQSLTSHATEKGAQFFEKYGPEITWKQLLVALEDRSVVRYACTVVFEATGLLPGEMAHPFPQGDEPKKGYALHVHPIYMTDLKGAVAIVLYQLVLVNYGEFAGAEDAEAFGAAALGMDQKEYYELLCGLADKISGCT
jgi:hypothetical protein